MGLLSSIFGSSSKSSTTQQTDARTVNDASAGGIIGSTLNFYGASAGDLAAILGRSSQVNSPSGAAAGGMQTPDQVVKGMSPTMMAGGFLVVVAIVLAARRAR